MKNLEFRPIKESETPDLADLFKRNNITFDVNFVIRTLNPLYSSKNLKFGCFQANKLVGFGASYFYKASFAGVHSDAATFGFFVIDKPLQGKGIGIRILKEIIKYLGDNCPVLISDFIDNKLAGKLSPQKRSWVSAIHDYYKDLGYDYKHISTITPVFRPSGKKLPEISINELSSYEGERISNIYRHGKEVIKFAENFYTRYYIAELPNENIMNLLDKDLEQYHWFSIKHHGHTIGYISCYHYPFHKAESIQNQLHFNHLMVDEVNLPGAVNAVICELEILGFKPHLYVINNSSLLDKLFLNRTGFFPGLSRYDAFLRCSSKDPFIWDKFNNISDKLRFSLTII